jgi:Flp pilus assembly pilin Flp
MDGLARSVGNGITGLVSGAFDAIGAGLRGMVDAGERALPNGLLWAVIFVLLVAGAWTIAKR